MKCVLAGGTCTAAILAFGIAAYAQTTGQTPSQPAGQPSSQPTAQAQSEQASEQQTLTGCVQSEADYRRARSAGQGGAAGTGVGVGNEFVLINASPASASAATGATSAPGTAAGAPSTSGSATAGTAGTSGASAMKAFELTGPGEGQLKQYVGKRVEIIGRVKHGQHSASGTSTSGTSTSGTSTSGTATGTQSGTGTGATRSASDPMGQDLNLPEFEVVSVREASGSCPAAPSQR